MKVDQKILKEKEDEEKKKAVLEEIAPSQFPLGSLPDVYLQHLAPFLQWSSRRSLSQVNSRFRGHYESLLGEAESLSIKGQLSVGVGDHTENQSVSYLSEFYTIRVEMDDLVIVEWTLKVESGVRTVVHVQYDGDERRETTISVGVSSKDYLDKMVNKILAKFQFKKIHLGVSGLAPLFASYHHHAIEIGVSDEIEYLQLAERLKPKTLYLFPPNQNSIKRGTLDLKKFPQLEDLQMYGIPMDLDHVLDSNVLKIIGDTLKHGVKLKHAKKIIDNWQSGNLNYKKVCVCSTTIRFPIFVPHTNWNEIQEHNIDEYYDHIISHDERIGSFSYSATCLEFIPWRENGTKEPEFWEFNY